MLTYKDRSFCTGDNCRLKTGCEYAITNKDIDQANKLDLLLSMYMAQDQDCFDPVEDNLTQTKQCKEKTNGGNTTNSNHSNCPDCACS